MAATIAEQQAVTVPASGASTITVTLTTTLVATDVIVLLFVRGSTSSMNPGGTVTGTWNTVFDVISQSNLRTAMRWITANTGAGKTITLNTNLSPYPARARVLVLRGLNSQTVDQSNSSGTWTTIVTTAQTSALTLGLDQVAVAFASSNTQAVDFPATGTLPASGWAEYDANSAAFPSEVLTMIGTGGTVSIQPKANFAAGDYAGVMLAVFGTAGTPPPAGGTFTGWGVSM